ncbi:MAG: protein translocase subunit SecD [Bryobacterales bacterium]|nr:protein translocase subunit SecD [Bryobacterales bacterium]
MPKSLHWKWILTGIVILSCIFGVIGFPKSAAELTQNWNRNIRLGLDLKGGAHIVMQIQVQDAFKAEADQLIERLKESLAKQNIRYDAIDRNDPPSVETANTIQIQVRNVPNEQAGELRRVATDVAGAQWILSGDGPQSYRLNLRPEAAIALRRDTLDRTVSTMERKISGLGVAEASVQLRGGQGGDAEVLVQLPGVDDPSRVRNLLQTTALLELSAVKGGPYATRESAYADHGGVIPLGTRLLRGSARSTDNGGESWWLVASSPAVVGRDIRDARAQQGDAPGRWDTGFVLSQDAARRFGRFTEANIGKRLAIVLDRVVISAPVVEGRIEDQGRILGMASQQDAADLALNLRAGTLPASAKVIEDRTVGPSLGADSIRRGVTAGLVGLLLVIASMIAYYRGAGWNAVSALLLNTIVTVASLSYIDATWTLPGIAGLVLSIGMAVDSNVLIFERIKEELRAGKGVAMAISAGFDRALVTIIDTHVTTVVASAFLFVFGTGPVRGFAVTLVIGLIANLFTAVFVSRAMFDFQLWRNPRLDRLSIGNWSAPQRAQFNFLSWRQLTLGLSLMAIAISIGSLIWQGGPKYGLDFRGGTLIYVRFAPKPPIDEVRTLLSSQLKGEVSVQETQDGEFIIGTGIADEASLEQQREAVRKTLRDKYGNTGAKLDLNNASRADIENRLRGPLAGVLGEEQVKQFVDRVLAYRDGTKSGIIGNLEELAQFTGGDARVLAAVKQECAAGSFNLRSAELVGPKAGEQLRQQAVFATLGALAGMLIYIAYRFQWVSGTAAVIATVHDVVITLGLFSLTGREINLNIIAALLTLIGYSMNDKIVVFDRVRENRHKVRGMPLVDLVNLSINQTLSRTLLTAGPTLLACLALYFLGGEVLNGIAFALFVGIIAGTYSSIFVASVLLVMWEERRGNRRGPARGAETVAVSVASGASAGK